MTFLDSLRQSVESLRGFVEIIKYYKAFQVEAIGYDLG